MSQHLTVSEALEMTRGFRAAQSGTMFDFRETPMWRTGWMMWSETVVGLAVMKTLRNPSTNGSGHRGDAA